MGMESKSKRRVLFVGEASFLATGFSTYWHEVIKRLHATGEFEIAEMGSYGHDDDPRCQQVAWKFYPAAPARNNAKAMQEYSASPTNQFGEWRFDDVCLDWRPSLVIIHRDWWMDEFILRSSLRHNFSLIWMPTIDGEPQRELWLDSYRQTDRILTYSEYGMNLLKKTARRGTNLVTVASPGADLETFKPPDNKREHKTKLGIDPDSLIVGCFAKDTPVLMADLTWKNIQDVYVDDKVIDADGSEQKVTHTYIFSDDKKMLNIKVMGEPETITLTHDHKILCVPRSRVLRWTTANGQKVIWNPMLSDYKDTNDHKWIPSFIEPNQLQRGDFWAFKIPDRIEDIEYLTTSEWAEQSKTGKKIPETIKLNEAFLKLCGLYLAEGSIGNSKDCPNHTVTLCINSDNQELIDNIIKWSKEAFGITPTIENLRPKNVCRVNINNVCVARMFVKLFGKYADKKRIPQIFKWLSPKKQLRIVRGWQLGDGCKSGNRNIGVSINLGLLLWFSIVLIRNGVVASINKRDMDKAKCFANAKQQWRLVERISGKRNEQFIYNGYLYSPIKMIKNSTYNEEKYDLTVKDSHSYVVYRKGVHNTVMRNQARKLYYDLIEAFSKWVNMSKSKGHLSLVKKTFLYLHTSYPDVGYDIGKAIRDFKVGSKVIMTYLCSNCQIAYPAFFCGEVMICRKCGKLAAHPPNANHSCPRNVLADIMKTFDIYVQYSISEGWGMPITEAQACGVPTMAVRYSAMEDHLQNPTSIPIEVGRFFWESIIQTEQRRALPDNADFVNKLDHFLKQKESVRDEKSKQTRAYTEELVDTYGQDTKMRRRGWERTAAIWGQVIRETDIKDQKSTWLCPDSKVHIPNLIAPSNDMNNSEFVNWVIGKIWNRPDMLNTNFAGDWLQCLNSCFRTCGDRRVPFDRKMLVEHFVEMINKSNTVETKRLVKLGFGTTDQIGITVI